MKKFINDYKYIIFASLIIILSYLMIATVPELFGFDDISANVYLFNKDFTFLQKINWVFERVITWNSRIGELLYFTIGCFPRWVYFTFSSIFIILFFNLIYFYIYGKHLKAKLNTLNYFITILIFWIITITIYPAFSETIIWMAGMFNHLIDITIILIAGIPFRLLFNKYDLFIEKPKWKIPFYIFCIFAGFNVENVVPWFLFYIACATIYNYIFNKSNKNHKWQIFSFFIVLVSFIILYILSSTQTRLNTFYQDEYLIITKNSFFITFLNDYKIFFIFFLIFIIFTFIVSIFSKKRMHFYKNLFLLSIQSITSFISIFVLILSPYYTIRTTVLVYFFHLSIIGYCLNYILKKPLIKVVSFILIICLIPISTSKLHFFYNDFNRFNHYNYEYMKMQIDEELKLRKPEENISIPIKNDIFIHNIDDNKLNIDVYMEIYKQQMLEEKPIIIKCTEYDNIYNVFLNERLTSYEGNLCTNAYINYYFKMDNLIVTLSKDKIR